MKKVLVVASVVAIVVVSIVIALSANRYSLDARVIERENNIIVFEDVTGNLWEYEDKGEYSIGDAVRLTWNDKGTEMKQDDEIIKVVAH